MWEIVLDSIVPAIILGIFATLISVLLTNKQSSNKDKREKQYALLIEIYNALYNEIKNMDGKFDSDQDKVGTVSYFENNLIVMYKNSYNKLESIKNSLKKIRFAYTIEELSKLDKKIEIIENQCKKLYFTSLLREVRENGNEDKIVIRDEIVFYDDNEDLQEHMRIFIDNTQSLYDDYMLFIENKLRSLIQ